MREKMELRTKKSAVILTACAPVALSVLPVLAISLLLLPPSFTLMILGLMIAACGLTMAFYIPSYLGSCHLPARDEPARRTDCGESGPREHLRGQRRIRAGHSGQADVH